MGMKQRRFRRAQGWLLVAYSMGILAMYGMDRGLWRHVVMCIAASLLVVVVMLLVRARVRGGCDGVANAAQT